MKTLKSIVKSIPPLHKLAKLAKSRLIRQVRDEILDEVFYTLSPDVLVAIVKAFNLQRQTAAGGRDLLNGHAYYEFGIFKGFSLWFAEQIAREYTDSSFRFLGFDSFEGLPQPQLEVEARAFREGDFRGTYEVVTGNLRRWKTDFSRIRLYKGFYSDRFFDQLRGKEQFPPVSICLIDVDLYNSCVPVLEFIKEYLVEGSILLFDDYNQMAKDDNSGESRALIEFESRNPGFKKECLFDYGWEGVAFRVVSL
jgi:Macrocin-O-methyltransferase (TylF)